jgi:hypothetical protein
MPRTAPRAKPAFAFPLAVLALYVAVLAVVMLPRLDLSLFIVAGDRFVTRADLIAPMIVKQHSDGYDGQFYFRMALDPLNFAQTADGVRIDWPAWRFQRIFYPLLVWMVSLGQVAWVPAGLVVVNLAGLAVVARMAVLLRRLLGLARWVPWAIVLWPGFAVSLTHDTTEILSAALLLSALCAYMFRRIALYCALAACAALTRETNLLVFLAIAAVEAVNAVRAGSARSLWRRVLPCGVVAVPFFAWRQAVIWLCGQAPQAHGVAHNLGWPMVGMATMLWGCLTGAQHFAGGPRLALVERALVLVSVGSLLVFCGYALRTIFGPWRHVGAALPAGFVCLVWLISLLTARGPLIDPTAYFRALTECYLLGCLVLGADLRPWRHGQVITLTGIMVFVTLVFVCRVQLR